MKSPILTAIASVSLLALTLPDAPQAGEVTIVAADFTQTDDQHWSVRVTLEHADSGWDHYADEWRVVDADGKVLGDRILYHPHVGEQPFTRGLDNVRIPDATGRVWIEAHDKVHGWTAGRLEVDLGNANGGHLRVNQR